MFVLGISWLILTPLCLWNLFRGGTLVRLTSVLALVALEAATIWTTTLRIPPRTSIATPPPPAAQSQDPLPAPMTPSPPPEAAQQGARGAQDAGNTQVEQPEQAKRGRQGGQGAPAARGASCPGRMPAPERVRLARYQGALRGVTLFWTARTDECDTATVVLRRRNRTLEVWMREGETENRPSGATTRPVSVTGGVASMEVPLAPPVRDMGAFKAVDGRTGKTIALGGPERAEEPPTIR